MSLRKLKSVSKVGLALVLVIASTVLFGIWWRYFKPDKSEQGPNGPTHEEVVQTPDAVRQVKEMLGSLFLADGDLMEMDKGTVLKKNWLRGPAPLALYFHEQSGRFIGRYERGFARYLIDGTQERELTQRFGIQVSDDMTLAVYPANGNIWSSGIDWNAFDFISPKQVTTVGGFDDGYVQQNVILAGKGGMVISTPSGQVRVNLQTGAVAPIAMPMTQAPSRRSPGGNLLVGDKPTSTGTTAWVYDVESESVKTLDLGRARMSETLWLNNDLCLLLIESQVIMRFSAKDGNFTEVMKLAAPAERLTGPSATGRFVFGMSQGKVIILDLEKKATIPVNFPPENVSWIADSTLLMARDIQDSQYRGTWVQPLDGGEAVRVATEPYSFTNTGATVLLVRAKDLVIFGTQHGLFRVKPDGSAVSMFTSLAQPVSRLKIISPMKN